MPSEKKVNELFILIISVIFISIGVYFTFYQKPTPSEPTHMCSKETPSYCTNEKACIAISLFWWNDSCHLDSEEISKPSEFSDYNYFQAMKHLELVPKPTASMVKKPNNIAENEKIVKRFIKQKGDIANAYLFVDTSVDNGKPLTVWDSIYISLQRIAINYNQEYPYKPFIDGHLLRSKTIKVPEGTATRLLYDMRNIPFTEIPYSDKNEPIYKNLIEMLNNEYPDGLNIIENANDIIFEFKTFLSTLRNGGFINKVSIGYECAENTPDCELSVIEK